MRQGAVPSTTSQVSAFSWAHPEFPLSFRVTGEGAVSLVPPGVAGAVGSAGGAGAAGPADASGAPGSAGALGSPGPVGSAGPVPVALPLVEVQVAGAGRAWSGERHVETVVGARLRYRGHEETHEAGWRQLRVELVDPATGLAAYVHYRSPDGCGAVRSWVRLVNEGDRRLVVEAVTSFAVAGLVGEPAGDSPDRLAGLDLLWADSDWLAEGRWQRRPVRDLLADVNRSAHGCDSRGAFSRASQGSWSTGRYLPMGALTDRATGRTLMWQIESAGGWRWEFGERGRTGYLALLGPTDRDHQWRQTLQPGDTFTTVPAAIALGGGGGAAHAGGVAHAVGSADGVPNGSADGFAEAVGAMTRYRRAVRRPHDDHTRLPVIFNDYMNTVMGDPTTERLLPLIDAAAEVGAEYFVIDAGWYDDDADGWWDSVGEWAESRSRFPGGLLEVLDRVRALGMSPGVWLEPEVVGLRSPVAATLPDEAFFQRDGIRVVEHGRHHLDLRHPAAIAHLDQVVDRLVQHYGVRYLKLDYNINPGPGTDLGGSAGAGLLAHQRAYTAWLSSILDRHPGLTLENCASGAMRADYALLAQAQLQSTSDQQDYLRYPPITAAAPAAIAPEQVAVWAYPQPDFSDDAIAFTLCGPLLGRVHLSGHLDRMTPRQRELVAEAVAVHKRIRADIAVSTPFWPLGLPGWTDPWLCHALRGAGTTYALLWHRDDPADPTRTLPLPHLRGHDVTARVLYPSASDADLAWNPDAASLTVLLPRAGTACLVALD